MYFIAFHVIQRKLICRAISFDCIYNFNCMDFVFLVCQIFFSVGLYFCCWLFRYLPPLCNRKFFIRQECLKVYCFWWRHYHRARYKNHLTNYKKNKKIYMYDHLNIGVLKWVIQRMNSYFSCDTFDSEIISRHNINYEIDHIYLKSHCHIAFHF